VTLGRNATGGTAPARRNVAHAQSMGSTQRRAESERQYQTSRLCLHHKGVGGRLLDRRIKEALLEMYLTKLD
jgi:hypothetical protein